jgi:hypothetical protein
MNTRYVYVCTHLAYAVLPGLHSRLLPVTLVVLSIRMWLHGSYLSSINLCMYGYTNYARPTVR